VAKDLTPVQRAQLFVMRERLHDRMRDAREHRRHGWGSGPGGHERGEAGPHGPAER
jgi:hypothetical protein